MAGNTLGEVFRVTTFGESHGAAIGAMIDGAPAGVEVSEADIQRELDRRKPGQSAVTTQRNESDKVEILSGIFDGKTTGTPIALLIRNTNHQSGDYSNLASIFRPGHADFGFFSKYGIRDYRGGGRSSGRETAARVAAGAVAENILAQAGIQIIAYVTNIAGIQAKKYIPTEIENNPVRCCDPIAAAAMTNAIIAAAAEGDSTGGVAECRILGVPAGLGEPVFDKLDAELAKAMLSIGSVKGIEFGSGFKVAGMRGSENNQTGHSGGISGGISDGKEIIFRIAVKPTPSISKPQTVVDIDGKESVCEIKGRHDPCILPRLIPVVEAMSAIVILDMLLRNRCVRQFQK